MDTDLAVLNNEATRAASLPLVALDRDSGFSFEKNVEARAATKHYLETWAGNSSVGGIFHNKAILNDFLSITECVLGAEHHSFVEGNELCLLRSFHRGTQACAPHGTACFQRLVWKLRVYRKILNLVEVEPLPDFGDIGAVTKEIERNWKDRSFWQQADLYRQQLVLKRTFGMMRKALHERRVQVKTSGEAAWYAAVAVDAILLFTMIGIVLILLIGRQWTPVSLAITIVSVVGLLCQLMQHIMRAFGFVNFGPTDPEVVFPEYSVQLMERMGLVAFLTVFSLFTWLLSDASLTEAHVKENTAAVRALPIVLFSLTGIIALYSIVTIILANIPISEFAVDVSEVLIPSGMLVLSLFLAGTLAHLWRFVAKEKSDHVKFIEMRRNVIIFFVASIMLAVSFLSYAVLSGVSLFAPLSVRYPTDDGAFTKGLTHQILNAVCMSLVALYIIAYFGIPALGGVISRWRGQKALGTHEGGYVPLVEGEVPAEYDV